MVSFVQAVPSSKGELTSIVWTGVRKRLGESRMTQITQKNRQSGKHPGLDGYFPSLAIAADSYDNIHYSGHSC